MSREQVELLVMQTAVQKEIKAITDETRTLVASEMQAGDRVSVGELGSVTLAKSTVKATVTDIDLLAGFLAGEADSGVEIRDVLDDTKVAEVLAVVNEHAPHLVRQIVQIADWAQKDALRRAEKGEQIPGVTVREVPGSLRVLASDAARERVQQVLAGGLQHIALEGGAQ